MDLIVRDEPWQEVETVGGKTVRFVGEAGENLFPLVANYRHVPFASRRIIFQREAKCDSKLLLHNHSIAWRELHRSRQSKNNNRYDSKYDVRIANLKMLAYGVWPS